MSEVNDTPAPTEPGDLSAEDAVASGVEQVAQANEEAKAQEQADQQKRDLLKKYKIKVDGKEEDFELNLDDEEEVKKHLQLSRVSQKRMQEYAKLKKDVELLATKLKEDPEYILEQAGIDVDALSERRLNRKLEEMQKSPEQKEKEAMQKEIETMRKRIQEEEEGKKREFELRMQQEQEQQIQNDILSALKEHQDLPESELVLEYISKYMMFAMEKGYDNVTVNDVIPYVKRDMTNHLRKWIGKVPDQIVEDLIGKDTFERARKHRLKQSRVPQSPAVDIKATGQENKPKDNQPKQKMKLNDFLKSLGNK